MSKIKVLFSFFIIFVIFIAILSVLLYFLTKKYNEKKLKLYAIFLDMSKREVLLISTIILNILISVFLVVNINNYDSIYIDVILINSIIFITLSFKFKLMFLEAFYTSSLAVIIRLLFLVNSYLKNVYYDKLILVLEIIFIVLIIIYVLFMNIRKFEILVNNNKYVRRNA